MSADQHKSKLLVRVENALSNWVIQGIVLISVITIYSLFLFWLISVRMAYGADQEHNPSTVGSPEHHGYIPARLKVSSTGDLIILYPKKYKKKNDRIPWKDFSFTKINRRQCSKTELIFVKKYEAETTGCLIFHFLTENNTQISILTCKK